MRLSITSKIFSAILAAAFLATVTQLLVMQWSVHRGFLRYLDAMDRATVERAARKLEMLYAERGDLGFLKEDRRFWTSVLISPQDLGWFRTGAGQGLRRPHALPLPFPGGAPIGPSPPERRLLVLDAARAAVLGSPAARAPLRPIVQGGQTVGYVGMLPPRQFLDSGQLRFLSQPARVGTFGARRRACGRTLLSSGGSAARAPDP